MRYPTFENLDKIAQIFRATPIQLFGTLKEIAVSDSNETLDRIDEYEGKLRSILQIQKWLEQGGEDQVLKVANAIEYIDTKVKEEEWLSNKDFMDISKQ